MHRAAAHGPTQHRCGTANPGADQLAATFAQRQAKHCRGPFGQELDTRVQHQCSEGPQQRARRRGATQYLKYFQCAVVTAQLRADPLQIVRNLRARTRHVLGAESFGNQRDFGVIAILLASGEGRVEITQV